MIAQINSLKTISCIYNFNTDTGAQGIYSSDFIIPTACNVISVNIVTTLSLASTGAAIINIGTTNLPNAYAGAQAYTNFVTGETIQFGGGAFRIASGGERITFTISVADLTDGNLTISVLYIEF